MSMQYNNVKANKISVVNNTIIVPANTAAMWDCGGVALFYIGFSGIFYHYVWGVCGMDLSSVSVASIPYQPTYNSN